MKAFFIFAFLAIPALADDLQLLQGNWSGVLPAGPGVPEPIPLALSVSGNTAHVQSPTGGFPPSDYRLTLNEIATPRSIAFEPIAGGQSGFGPAIYELSGNMFRVCLGAPGSPLPPSMASCGQNETTLILFTRQDE